MSGVSVLELKEVVKYYTDRTEEIRAVDNVSFSIPAGTMAALYGPSGSGKTTLLLLAASLLTSDDGKIRFNGRDITSMSNSEVTDYQRREVGFIYQSFHLMSGVPAIENAAVKLLADGVSLKRARVTAGEWLEKVGLTDRRNHTPERLSGGERQRVAIARALVNKPKLILADEPTGSLDSERGLEILNMLAGIARDHDTAVLLVTHDPQAAMVADTTISLRDGKIVSEVCPEMPGGLPLIASELA